MRREAESSAALAGAESGYRFQILRRGIVQAALQLALADELLRVGGDDLALLDRMLAFARERQRAGLDSNLELLRLENERARRAQQVQTDRRQRDFERATLNRLLNRPPDGAWPEFDLPPVAPEIPLTETLFTLAAKFEPRLQAMRQDIAMAEAGVEVTRRSRLPDVTLGVEGRQWSGSGGFREGMFTVGLNLPWVNRSKYRADLDRDRHRAEAARAEADDYALDVRRELFRVWTRIDAARRETLLYRDEILPRSELAVSTALAAWSTGRGMYLEVMDARRMLVEARVMRARALAEQHQMIAELVTCCGVAELDSILMLETPPDPASPPTSAPPPASSPGTLPTPR
jgi:cobalt-zinc-cadmium efflux system outer membrane protein